MSRASLHLAGILLVLIPTVVYGGVSILYMWITKGKKYYVENPLRQRLWRAGHAHAGVLLVLSLVMLLYVDQAELPSHLAAFVRTSGPLAAILVPSAYFLSVIRPAAERPNRLINLAYVGALVLAAGVLTLGIGLIRTT